MHTLSRPSGAASTRRKTSTVIDDEPEMVLVGPPILPGTVTYSALQQFFRWRVACYHAEQAQAEQAISGGAPRG